MYVKDKGAHKYRLLGWAARMDFFSTLIKGLFRSPLCSRQREFLLSSRVVIKRSESDRTFCKKT